MIDNVIIMETQFTESIGPSDAASEEDAASKSVSGIMTKLIESFAAFGERAINFAIVPETQSTESVEHFVTSGENVNSKSVSGMMRESIMPSATSEGNAIKWNEVHFKPVSEYAGFGGLEEVQIDDNSMLYNYYHSVTYLIKRYTYYNNNLVILICKYLNTMLYNYIQRQSNLHKYSFLFMSYCFDAWI